jgi:hypothetical protein
MAYTAATFLPLSSMANSDAPRHWTYASADAHATIVGSGYFNDAADLLNVNDIIHAVGATGGTQTLTTILVDAISAAGVVTVVSSVQTLS